MLTCVLGRCAASTVLLVARPSEGADSVSGQLRRDKERPFSGVTSSGRGWRKVLESDARSVGGLVIAQAKKLGITKADNPSLYNTTV